MRFVANKEIIEKVRRIKILSKRLTENHLAGDYASAFKGSGFEFDQLREYQYGDDVRFIDWNASAKNDAIMLKEFTPERDRSIILVVDCSASMHYSSKEEFKKDAAVLIAAALAFIASSSNDKVGLLAYADTIKAWLPPQKGRLVFTKILDTLCLAMSQGGATSTQEAIKFLLGQAPAKSIIFFISDWVDCDENFSRELKILAYKHEPVIVRILDELECKMPDCGVLEIEDPETLERFSIDTSSKSLGELLQARLLAQNRLFQNCGLEKIDIRVGDRIDRKLANFFQLKTRRRKK